VREDLHLTLAVLSNSYPEDVELCLDFNHITANLILTMFS